MDWKQYMMRVMFFFAVAMGISLAGSAQADWQFSRWGDAPETVIKYKEVNARRATKTETADQSYDTIGNALVTAPYLVSDIRTNAWFLFRNGGLTGVSLTISSQADAMRALSLLRSQYGEDRNAFDKINGLCREIRMKWEDKTRGNRISFRTLFCPDRYISGSILFAPILNPSKTGL